MTKRRSGIVNDRLKIGHSGLSGKGVFALRSYRTGEVVEVCPYITMDENDVQGELLDYVFEGSEDHTVLCVLGYGMIYNHSNNPNLELYEGDNNAIEFVALRDIQKGEELTHHYGEEWWNTRAQRPR